MAQGICDIDGHRPATHQVTITQNGRTRKLELCNIDYQRLREQQSMASPFESLFRGEGLFDMAGSDFPSFASDLGYPLARDREAVRIEDFLSDQTKDIMQRAAEVAVRFGRREVDTEHLLYALLDSDIVAQILRGFKLKPDELRSYLDEHAPKGQHAPNSEDEITVGVSPRVKATLEQAFAISRSLGHSYIGPEHLLAALASEDEGLAGDVLRRYGLTPESIRQQIVRVVGRGREEGRAESQSHTPKLDQYSRDLSAMAREGKLDPVIGRAEEIETTVEILSRRTKNNPALIGEPGVGKTAIVEGLAQRINAGKVPQVLLDKRVVEVNLNAIVAGSKYRGEFEERIKDVLDEITANSDELIIFIDELHTIVGAGAADGGLDVANVIKPALSRGELHLIGATTLDEYQKHIERDAALERRFQPVLVGEPTVEQTIEILRGLRDRYEAHHKIKITDEAIVAAAELSDRYITGRFLPDKAIDLVDQAAARVRIGADTFSREISDLDDQIKNLSREIDFASSHKNYDDAKTYETQLAETKQTRDARMSDWRARRGSESPSVGPEHIAAVVSRLTGIPVQELTQEERDRLLRLEDELHKRVIAQDEAVTAVSDAIRLSRARLTNEQRPIASFIFLGPTGVGKTELAKALAWQVFGSDSALIRIDMTEYMERHSVSRLIGAPPGYVGYDEGGQLTERVRRRPHSLILLDEIEKAHPDVQNILLQVLDDGRLTDGQGRVVDFANTIIIATSNVGSHLIQEELTKPEAEKVPYDNLKVLILEQLWSVFRPEFINRIDEIIVFHALNRQQVRAIVGLQLERVARTARGEGIDLVFDKSLVDHLVDVGYVPEFGARELKRQIRSGVEHKLAREMLANQLKEGTAVRVTYSGEHGVTFEQLTKPVLKEQQMAFREELPQPESDDGPPDESTE
jgi:ATP-dependent Clp protease ATP-binding subunit ClpC